MLYNVGDKMVLAGIPCKVALVNAYGFAYLKAEVDDEKYNNRHTQIGVIFATINPKGLDRLGNQATYVDNGCGAV